MMLQAEKWGSLGIEKSQLLSTQRKNDSSCSFAQPSPSPGPSMALQDVSIKHVPKAAHTRGSSCPQRTHSLMGIRDKAVEIQ